MSKNELWVLLSEEVDRTIISIDELKKDLSDEFHLISLEKKREELLLRKYWLINIQESLRKMVTGARHAGIEYHDELKLKIKSAMDNNNFEEFNYCETWSKTEF